MIGNRENHLNIVKSNNMNKMIYNNAKSYN